MIGGGIVAVAHMYVSVNERIGEIGMRRAVVGMPAEIRGEFVMETGAAILTGGMGGIAIGYIGVQLIATRMHLGSIFSWTAVVVSLMASAITGLLAGVVPARRAAQLHPADALR